MVYIVYANKIIVNYIAMVLSVLTADQRSGKSDSFTQDTTEAHYENTPIQI